MSERMRYQDFFNKTRNVELYPFSAESKIHDKFALESAYKLSKGKVVSGLYFPNDLEIISLWKLLATDNQKEDLELFDKIYDLQRFADGLLNTINAPVAGQIIEPIRAVASTLHKPGPGINSKSISAQELTDMVGNIYEKTGLLENDIRIKAFEFGNLKNMTIVEFKPAAVGYVGIPLVGSYK